MSNLDELTSPITIEVSKVPWTIQGSVSASTSLLASDTISNDYAINLVQGSGGAVTLTSTPTIQAGDYNGQTMTIIGMSDTNLVTLQDESNLANSGLRHDGAHDFILGLNDNISYVWLTHESKWVETGRVDSY